MNPETISDEQVTLMQRVSLFCLGCNVAAATLSIAVILRFTRSSMRDMKWHLLNIAVMVLLSDLFLDLVALPLPVYPFLGACVASKAGMWLHREYGNQAALSIVIIVQVTFLGGAGVAVSNATLHRFYTTKHVGSTREGIPRRLLLFMASLQFGYMPMLGFVLSNLNPMPDYMVELVKEEYPLILERIHKRPHYLHNNIFQLLWENPIFVIGILLAALAIAYCVLGTMAYAWLAWKLLNGMHLSDKAMKMRKQLMVSFLLQSILPFAAMILGGLVAGFVLFIQPSHTTPYVVFCYLIFGMHSVLNSTAMCLSIPPYRRGIAALFFAPIRRFRSDSGGGLSTVDSVTKVTWFHRRRRTATLIGIPTQKKLSN